ncbi:peroxide stress protein YaaA [Chakrabartyella piscis]|uniref:peroxide stress protein YaaA n=1 Tax=Chakrabartyella piscis TaxID=2918914 RepID=UPI0029589CF5|nr:peroxide stress protein YaaA [Chakrabartyella piscis]
MKIILSPAKKMNMDVDSGFSVTTPTFLEETKEILSALQEKSPEELQKLWKCNDSIAKLNVERLRYMDLERNVTPAIFAYEGIQYQYMSVNVFEESQFDYLNDHLRILSGFYGVLKPFDGVTPYRLEMQAKLSVSGTKDLYAFWDDALAKELALDGDFILNLASKEYSKTIEKHLPKEMDFITCVFGEIVGDKIVEKGTMCKMARGRMVRYLAENHITDKEDIKKFNIGYQYQEELSTKNQFVFLRSE